MENETKDRGGQRPAYEAPELEVALVAGPGVRTETVYSDDAGDNDYDSKNLFG